VGGPGRPPRSTEAAYLRELSAVCTAERWRQACEKALGQAVGGCPKARDFLARYLLESPGQVADLVQQLTAELERLKREGAEHAAEQIETAG
jgi:hypothetical protein